MNRNEIEKYLEERMKESGISSPTLEDINKFMGEWIQQKNHRSRDDFEGFSATEMGLILHHLLQADCPVQLADYTDLDCSLVPLFRQLKLLLNLLEKEGSFKLTQTGNLPVRVVKAIYDVGLPSSNVESGIISIRSENDSTSVQMTHIAAQISRLSKKQNNKLSLTKKGKDLLSNDSLLLTELLTVMLTQFNTAYFDNDSSENIGNIGKGFSLILLDKYGEIDRPYTFYSDKYFQAFPKLLEEITERYMPREKMAALCYLFRIFGVLFENLGLISYQKGAFFETIIHRHDIFEKLFIFKYPY